MRTHSASKSARPQSTRPNTVTSSNAAAATAAKNTKQKHSADSHLIKVISKDCVRTLRPHGTASLSTQPYVLPEGDLSRIRKELSGGAGRKNNGGNEKERLEDEARARRARIQEYDRALELARQAQQKHSDAEEGLATREQESATMLQKAQRQMEEQEDEIRRMNELILHTKCMMIREAQMAERKLIQSAEKEEERRLDAMMEYDRVHDIQRVLEREKKRKEEMKQGALVVRHQIAEHEEAKILAAERLEREAHDNKQQWQLEQQREDERRAAEKLVQREHLEKVRLAKEANVARRAIQRAKEREEDVHIMEYLVERAKIAEERETEERQKKVERDRELARVQALQQMLQDSRAEQDAIRAKRAMEEYEREWRRKEKEALIRKKSQEAELLEARHRQQLDREHVIAVEALKARNEFFDMLKSQQEAEEKLQREKADKGAKMHKFTAEVQKQVAEREQNRRNSREQFALEGKRMHAERLAAEERIQLIKQRKLAELAQLGIPDKHCKQIARQMQRLAVQKISDHPASRSKAQSTPASKASA